MVNHYQHVLYPMMLVKFKVYPTYIQILQHPQMWSLILHSIYLLQYLDSSLWYPLVLCYFLNASYAPITPIVTPSNVNNPFQIYYVVEYSLNRSNAHVAVIIITMRIAITLLLLTSVLLDSNFFNHYFIAVGIFLIPFFVRLTFSNLIHHH